MLIKRGRWHIDTDVVIIGYGAAGAVAAISASSGGADVIILEKQQADRLITNSAMSAGVFICPSDVQEASRYMEALYKIDENLFWTEPDVIHAWARYTVENKKWLDTMGGMSDLYRHGGEHKVRGYEYIDNYRFRGMGPGLMRFLYSQVSARSIQVMYDMSATELLMNSKDEVTGVRASADGRWVDIRARRAVILATGGFEYNDYMKLQYLKVYPSYFTGSPANTGDGVRMGLGVGAQLWHMNCCAARFVMRFPDFPVAMDVAFGGRDWAKTAGSTVHDSGGSGGLAQRSSRLTPAAGYIVVDKDGKRFTNENFKSHSLYYELTLFDTSRLFYPRVPSYWVFDQQRMNEGTLAVRAWGATGPARVYSWSNDNSEELKRGWIKCGNTIKDLASKLGIEPRTLQETVDSYNLYCKQGEDPEYRRVPETLIPLSTPPYYAVELWPGGPNTQGGPRRNSKARVLRADGAAVPRLYSAGELGSIYGMLYPAGGGNLAECIAFGRIAGENACEQAPL